tara:strand:+ start:83 stop:559 length:477 start_codon:yes stop_codon:yes gene_type:complete
MLKSLIRKYGNRVGWLILYLFFLVFLFAPDYFFQYYNGALTVGGIIFISLILGYFTKIIKPINSSWGAAIGLVLVAIILIRSVVEWYFVNINLAEVPHQSGWHFLGIIMQIFVIIPIAFFRANLDKYDTKEISINVFLNTSLIIILVWEFFMTFPSLL